MKLVERHSAEELDVLRNYKEDWSVQLENLHRLWLQAMLPSIHEAQTSKFREHTALQIYRIVHCYPAKRSLRSPKKPK